MPRKSTLWLNDISNTADKIIAYTNEISFLDFIDNDITIYAVMWNYQVIEEAAKKVPRCLQYDNPQIDWKRLSEFRDHLVHQYFQIDYELAWNTKQEYLGKLVDLIDTLTNTLINSGKENYYDSDHRRSFRRWKKIKQLT